MEKRICKQCGKQLSIYNPNDRCYAHFVSKKHRPEVTLEGVRTDRNFVKTYADCNGTHEDFTEL